MLKLLQMKILIVSQFYYPENFVIYKIAETLQKFGHDVHVLTGRPNYGYGYILPEYKKIKEEEINGVRVHRVDLPARKRGRLSIIFNYLGFWYNSRKWVRKTKLKFDVVYSFQLSPVTILSAGNLYKKKHHVKHICHCVDLWPESVLVTNAVRKKSLTYKILYSWSKKLYRACDEILIGSPSYKEYFATTLQIMDKNIVFVPQPSLVENSRKIKTQNLGEGFNILYCGNIGTIQMIEMIPEAMKLVKNSLVKFHIIGMGPMSKKLVNKITELKLEDKVIYHGPLPSPKAAPYFKGANALYVSLKNEGIVGKTIPNKLVMSMAFTKPILAMLEGDGKRILTESKGGIFARQDVKFLARAIDKIAAIPTLELKKLGELNQIYYAKHFSLETITRKIEKHLR